MNKNLAVVLILGFVWGLVGCKDKPPTHQSGSSAQPNSGKEVFQPGITPHPAKGMENFYSIGVIDSNGKEEVTLMRRYFASNGVTCFLEGRGLYDVFIPKEQLARAKELLESTPPAYSGFTAAAWP